MYKNNSYSWGTDYSLNLCNLSKHDFFSDFTTSIDINSEIFNYIRVVTIQYGISQL